MYHWIITAIVLPVPFIHLWLHALLPFWRKRPGLFYAWGTLLFIGAFLLAPRIDAISPIGFTPSPTLKWMGVALMICGLLAAIVSIATLGLKRFFLLAVLKPATTEQMRVGRGIFRLIPHPAYLGYLIVAIGNLLSSGKLYLAGATTILFALTPIVIWLEEEELRKRVLM